jgi:hypothetical protein
LKKAPSEDLEGQFIIHKIVEHCNDEDSIKFLENYGRLKKIEVGSKTEYYVKNPNTKLSPVWVKIYQNMYKSIFQLVNSCRSKKLLKITSPNPSWIV